MAKSLRAKHPEGSLHILVAKRNSGSFTYDGIERGGERVCQEIEQEIEKLAKEGQEIKRISLVGYSLGGLISRYAIGLLDSKGFFDKIKPVVSLSLPYFTCPADRNRTSPRLPALISAYGPLFADGTITFGTS